MLQMRCAYRLLLMTSLAMTGASRKSRFHASGCCRKLAPSQRERT